MQIKKDFERSEQAIECLKISLRHDLGYELISCRKKFDESSAFEKTLDRQCGIDGILKRDGQYFPVALRADLRQLQAFTIRILKTNGHATEWQKVNAALLMPNALRPIYHIQVMPRGNRIAYAIAQTKELFQYIDTNMMNVDKVQKRIAPFDGNNYVQIPWSYLHGHEWFQGIVSGFDHTELLLGAA